MPNPTYLFLSSYFGRSPLLMIHRTSFVVTAIAASFVSLASQANPGVVYNDATGDIDPNVSTGGGTLDLVRMEVSHTATDLVFALTVNGNVTSTDWGKFMIGISNGSAGDTSVNGNGWGRPINMGSPTGGMTNWLGSWVDSGGGAENRSWATGWSVVGATYNSNFGSFAIASGAQSTITYTVSMASLGLADGNTAQAAATAIVPWMPWRTQTTPSAAGADRTPQAAPRGSTPTPSLPQERLRFLASPVWHSGADHVRRKSHTSSHPAWLAQFKTNGSTEAFASVLLS
jgi:hypothetical protein